MIFLGLVTLFAFLLPTGYTLGLLKTAGLIVQIIIGIFIFLGQLFLFLITVPILWLLSLFGFEDPTSMAAIPPPTPVTPPDVTGTAPPWFEILRSLLFWVIALGVLIYFIKIYMEDHPEMMQGLKNFKPIAMALRLFSAIWQTLTGLAKAGLELLPARQPTIPPVKAVSKSRVWEWLNLRQLSTRQRILYYYLNILNRAEQVGLHRRQSQTPYEYEPNLQESIPTVETEIHDVTDTFVRARYSPDEFTEQDVTSIKQEWQRIKKALRKGKGTKSSE